jgi:hypothetical protein
MEGVTMIEFHGVDLVIQDRVDDDHVRRAVAMALGVPANRIALIDDVGDYPGPDAADVVCVSSAVGGEFSRLLSLQVERLALPYDAPLQLLQRICDLLGTPCLSPDEQDASPYSMWSLRPGAPPGKVSLDAAAQDDGRYVVRDAAADIVRR